MTAKHSLLHKDGHPDQKYLTCCVDWVTGMAASCILKSSGKVSNPSIQVVHLCKFCLSEAHCGASATRVNVTLSCRRSTMKWLELTEQLPLGSTMQRSVWLDCMSCKQADPDCNHAAGVLLQVDPYRLICPMMHTWASSSNWRWAFNVETVWPFCTVHKSQL